MRGAFAEPHATASDLAYGAASPSIVGPPQLDLGDIAVGALQREKMSIFNRENEDADVSVAYRGSPSISLESSPQHLRPAREGNDPDSAIGLVFSPTAKGHSRGELSVYAAWRSGARPPVELHIPVVGAAHEIGEPPLAQQEAEARAREAQDRADARDQKEMDRARQAADQRLARGQASGTAVARERLRDASEAAAAAVERLFANRRAGVTAASNEASKYSHHEPEYHESLLETLAFAALDIVTAGIAGALEKHLEGALLQQAASKGAIALFTAGVKDVVKKSGKTASAPLDHDDNPTEISSNAMVEFFSKETVALLQQDSKKSKELATHARLALEPMLDKDPQAAIATMNAIEREIDKVATSTDTTRLQSEQSALHWIEYVARSRLGSVRSKQNTAEPTTNIDAANFAPSAAGAPRTVEGLVDVTFDVDLAHPTQPVTVVEARVNGVSNAIAEHLKHIPLIDAKIPVRAIARGYGNSAVVELEAIRDEAGRIAYRDETGAPGMPGRYFEHKAGVLVSDRDAALRGARKMMEEEIMVQPLEKVETDSDDKTR